VPHVKRLRLKAAIVGKCAWEKATITTNSLLPEFNNRLINCLV